MRPWYDDIDTATLQRIKTYSAFNDPESKNLMVQTMYEYKQEEIAELEEKISVLLSCKNCLENKGGFICVKEYENKCLAQKIQYIKELQEENAELRKDKKELCHSISEGGKACVYLNEQLTKAKDHIKKLLGCLQQDTNDPQTNYYVVKYMTEAEQFLKDSEVEK